MTPRPHDPDDNSSEISEHSTVSVGVVVAIVGGLFLAFATVAGVYGRLTAMESTLSRLEADTHEIKAGLDPIRNRISSLEARVADEGTRQATFRDAHP